VGGTYNRFGGFYAVRQGDAHSWLEVYLPGFGWQRFDPTPPSSVRQDAAHQGGLSTLREVIEAMSQTWDRHVVGFDLEQQVSLLQRIKQQLEGGTDRVKGLGKGVRSPSLRELLAIGGIGILLLAAYLTWRKRKALQPRPQSGNVAKSVDLYRRLERALLLHGVLRSPGVPPLRHARALRDAGHPAGPLALELTELYLRGRFSGQALTVQEEQEFLRQVGVLKKMAQGAPKERDRAA
jgi:protein-glutamine gamma-glutamyltransferase